MKAWLAPEAEFELIDGPTYYAREANAELGLAFIAEFERTLEQLCQYPELGPTWRGASRRIPMRRFPYSVIYQIHGDELRVLAVAHQSRRPDYSAGRE